MDHSPSFLASAFSVATRLRADVRLLLVGTTGAATILFFDFFDDAAGVFEGLSSPDSTAVLDWASGESDVRGRLLSFGLFKSASGRAQRVCKASYSSDPSSLLPRFRPLALLADSPLLESCLLNSIIRFSTSSSYSASREFMVVRRFWFSLACAALRSRSLSRSVVGCAGM